MKWSALLICTIHLSDADRCVPESLRRTRTITHNQHIILTACCGCLLPFLHELPALLCGFIKSWKTSAVSTTMWMVETQLLQAAWYIRYLHKLSFARVLCFILMKDIGRWLPWMLPGSTENYAFCFVDKVYCCLQAALMLMLANMVYSPDTRYQGTL